ncbi:trehalose-6-phosphate synthase [Monocercomonoides exilis]|uniref:trehalose-6-phosphate synthase n=1 Tax=Monocercomonoides exilis TaxID=2049356 RepID=UPI003559C7FC|nr:trehalose-6-phosphate synthase [Monocercomonoides exilis]|eukprot:MONOS_3243.1-p1 / transcript=MONOS_3243.1 / gene=MONOS_3243 / organism=Monocercomonoides_exilis_PA203 / gene_product=trehalose-6-phosphate synthase / transcript_product=trehalose-6-phosphate synthase / location=Mono_scaffold00075:14619-17837(+) / protein_length=1073 / sequence_SO=supercontig / SO=protein_coding / is_pseudo=false
MSEGCTMIKRSSIENFLPEETPTRFIIVSNRLPVTFSRKDEETLKAEEGKGLPKFVLKPSSGGLIAGVMGLTIPYVWVGWLGQGSGSLSDFEKAELKQQIEKEFGYIPVFVPDDVADLYYNTFSNQVLWPIFHYRPFNQEANNQKSWQAYQTANKLFADAILDVYKDGDAVWIHDYQLMLVSQFLRQKQPTINIGFFLHIPFPSSELFRTLPQRRDLLDSLLDCSLLGFHTFDYCQHFVSTTQRVMLDAEATSTGIACRGRQSVVSAFPIGIDPQHWTKLLDLQETKDLITKYSEQFKGVHLVIGVDRVDYTKGLLLKMRMVEAFLKKYPQMKQKFVLYQVGVPSRIDVKEYQELTDDLHRLVGEINGRYATMEWMPIHYINRPVSPIELCASYATADACVVTSVRDGMNLVALEYVASQRDRHGQLVLSEFAGAAMLMPGAFLINPWNIEESADILYHALQVKGTEEGNMKHRRNYAIVHKNTAANWGKTFTDALLKVPTLMVTQFTEQETMTKQTLLTSFRNATGERFFFLDYDGTLTQIVKEPSLASPKPKLLSLLKKLAALDRTRVFIVSGRDRETLGNWFKDVPVGLVAEHGIVFRDSPINPIIQASASSTNLNSTIDSNNSLSEGLSSSSSSSESSDSTSSASSTSSSNANSWRPLLDAIDLSWMDVLLPLLTSASEHTPGSFVEQKPTSLCFHYRQSPLEFGARQAAELRFNLSAKAATLPVEVISGKFVIEVRLKGVNKGVMLRKLLSLYANSHSKTQAPTPIPEDAVPLSIPPTITPTSEEASMVQPMSVPPTAPLPRSASGSAFSASGSSSVSGSPSIFSPLAEQLLQPDDFVICCGDDRTDEDMFEFVNALPSEITLTVIVGSSPSQARARVENPSKLCNFLLELVRHEEGAKSGVELYGEATGTFTPVGSPCLTSIAPHQRPAVIVGGAQRSGSSASAESKSGLSASSTSADEEFAAPARRGFVPAFRITGKSSSEKHGHDHAHAHAHKKNHKENRANLSNSSEAAESSLSASESEGHATVEGEDALSEEDSDSDTGIFTQAKGNTDFRRIESGSIGPHY